MPNFLIEAIGLIATILIFIGMNFKTDTLKGDIAMRIFNLVGSAIFAVYGFLVPAWSTAVLNCLLVIVNTAHLVILLKNKKNETTKSATTENKTE